MSETTQEQGLEIARRTLVFRSQLIRNAPIPVLALSERVPSELGCASCGAPVPGIRCSLCLPAVLRAIAEGPLERGPQRALWHLACVALCDVEQAGQLTSDLHHLLLAKTDRWLRGLVERTEVTEGLLELQNSSHTRISSLMAMLHQVVVATAEASLSEAVPPVDSIIIGVAKIFAAITSDDVKTTAARARVIFNNALAADS